MPRAPSRPSTVGGRNRSPSPALGTKADALVAVASRLGTPMYISDRALLPEQEILQLVQGMLQIPTLVGSMTEDQLVACAPPQDGLVTDPAFPPTTAALYSAGGMPPQWAMAQPLVWRRVSGSVYLPSGLMPRLLQGCLADHPFLGALAAVAAQPDLLLDLVVSDNAAEQGCFTLQLYKHGAWHRVVVDNYLPCVEGEEKLAFTCSNNVGELWPSLIEKAYAKLHGYYSAIEGGSVVDCLTDLTGGVAVKVVLGDTDDPGQLWHQLQVWLAEGAVVACKAKVSNHLPDDVEQPEDAVQGPGGILLNHVYSIVGLRELDGSTHLIRLHCPWPSPAGIWQGSWAPGSPEWESSAAAQQLANEAHDAACAWVPLREFMNVFNRLYVCRRFPASWHHLTLHCGWQGTSAGGPPTRPTTHTLREVANTPGYTCMSSTWCCNPQFQLTVRKACEVVVALGQQDPRVEARGHVRKSARKRSIGLVVLACKRGSGAASSVASRVWTLPQPGYAVISDGALTAARERVVSFSGEPGTAYVLVPHAGRAGEEGAFVMRCYAGAPLEVEQLPSPLSLVLAGSWQGMLAGGPPSGPTWGSNPQYLLSSPTRAKVVVSLTRLDIKYAVLKPAPTPAHTVGVHVCIAERSSTDGLVVHRSSISSSKHEVIAESEYTDIQEAALVMVLEPCIPYILVPSLASPELEAGFELRLMSSVPLELVPLPELCTSHLTGAWQGESAGGCDLAPTWRKNPRFSLAVSQRCAFKFRLCRVQSTNRPGSPGSRPVTPSVDDMIGFYVIQASSGAPSGGITTTVKGDMRRAIVAESAFTSMAESCGEHVLQEGSYLVIPCKYGAGRQGRFSLSVSAPAPFRLTPV